MKKSYMLAIILLLQGCSSLGTTMTNVKVLENGSDPIDAFCSKFSLSNSQAIELLNRSIEVEINEFHNNYEYLPCFVKGTLQKDGIECSFTIRAGGTVELSCSDNSGFLYVCDSCDDLLRDSE